MSHVTLIASDHELPLCDKQEYREHKSGGITVGFPCGFRVAEHRYYRAAVDALGFALKPCQYELDITGHDNDWRSLIGYLRENLSPGEEVELLSLWVGDGGGERLLRSRGKLSEFDLNALGMLTKIQYEPDLTGEFPGGLISQICLTVEMNLPKIPRLMSLEQVATGDTYEFACAHRYPESHWSPDSLYLADELWGIGDLIPDLDQVFPYPSFNWYGPTQIPLDRWERVEKLALARRPKLEPFFRTVRAWLERENRGADHFWILGP